MNKRERLQTILLEILPHLHYEGGSGRMGRLPPFDYYPLDYLDFAERNLTQCAELCRPEIVRTHSSAVLQT